MKVFVIALVSLLSLNHSEGFSIKSQGAATTSTTTTRSSSACSVPLFATQKNQDGLKSNANVRTLQKKATSFVAAVALGWSVAASASFAATMPVGTAGIDTDTYDASRFTSTSVMVSLSDKDYADFSMPSYQETANSAVNSNLKGDKFLLGEASRLASVSSSSAEDTTTVTAKPAATAATKESTVEPEVDKKAAKEAAKARQKAAREAQLAAAEAAVAAAAAK